MPPKNVFFPEKPDFFYENLLDHISLCWKPLWCILIAFKIKYKLFIMVRKLYINWPIHLYFYIRDHCWLQSLISSHLSLPQNKLTVFLSQDLCPWSFICLEWFSPSFCTKAPLIIQVSVQWCFFRVIFVTPPLFLPFSQISYSYWNTLLCIYTTYYMLIAH